MWNGSTVRKLLRQARAGGQRGLGPAQRMGAEFTYEDLKARSETILIMSGTGKSELLCQECVTGLLISPIGGCWKCIPWQHL